MALAPYIAFAWATPLVAVTHVAPMVWFDKSSRAETIGHQVLAHPEGQRVLFCWHSEYLIWNNPADKCKDASGNLTQYQSPWLDGGAAETEKFFEDFWPRFKNAGGDVDFLVTDAEIGCNVWVVKPEQLAAIAADPRFPSLGGKAHLSADETRVLITHAEHFMQYNAAIDSLQAGYFREGFFDPMHKLFPDAGYSEFNNGYLTEEAAKMAPDVNGWHQYSLGPLFGTHQSMAYYHVYGQVAWEGRNDGSHADFAASPMPTLIWETESARAHTIASDNPQIPWIGFKSYHGDGPKPDPHCPMTNSPYYEEALWHIMLSSNATDVLYWNPRPQNVDRSQLGWFQKDAEAIGSALGELAKQTDNAATIHCLTLSAVPYNSKELITGAECDGVHGKRKVYRVTLSPGEKSASITLPGETTARTITPDASGVGAWIVEN